MNKSVKSVKKPVQSNSAKKIRRLQSKNMFLRFCLILLIVGLVVGLSLCAYHLFTTAASESFWHDLLLGIVEG